MAPHESTIGGAVAAVAETTVEEAVEEMSLETTASEDAQMGSPELETKAEQAAQVMPVDATVGEATRPDLPDTTVEEATEPVLPDTTAEEEEPARPAPRPRCVICESEEAKYKCPRCQLP